MNKDNKKRVKDAVSALRDRKGSGNINSDVLGSYTGIPIDENMVSKNDSGGKTYKRLYSSSKVPTQDADDL